VYNIKKEIHLLAPAAERASRLRLTLRSLLADCQRQVQQLLPLRQLLKGSVYHLHTRCGKPSCHCASDDGPPHTSIVLSWSERGKTRLRSLPAGERARCQQWTQNYRRFRQARAALVKLHRRLLATMDRLEKTLRRPPPRLAARRRKK
jgi:hypothetical protein